MKKTAQLNIRLSPKEYDEICEKSENHGLTMSSFMRNLAMNYKVYSTVDAKAINDLLKVAADQGRLGGLLKSWLSQNSRDLRELNELIKEITDTQALLKAKARELLKV